MHVIDRVGQRALDGLGTSLTWRGQTPVAARLAAPLGLLSVKALVTDKHRAVSVVAGSGAVSVGQSFCFHIRVGERLFAGSQFNSELV